MKALIFEKFVRAIKKHRMLDKGDRIIVAVSGGADSIALLHLLVGVRRVYSLDLRVAHLNHGLRGSESEADERFVGELAAKLEIPLTVERIPKHEVPVRMENLENWARERRYDFFSRCAVKLSGQKVGLGHTMTDQAETFLMRLIRGSGSLGLASIPPKRGTFVRPLIELQRHEIRAYLESCGLQWREDASNDDTRFLRNRIRLELLPLLMDRYNPRMVEVLANSAQVLRDESDTMVHLTAELFHREARIGTRRVTWGVKGLRAHPVGLRNHLIRQSMSHLFRNQRTPSLGQVKAVADLLEDGKSGRIFSTHDLKVIREFDFLVLQKQGDRSRKTEGYCHRLSIPGKVELVETGSIFTASREAVPAGRNAVNRWELYLDEGELRTGFTVRNWVSGDVYSPQGASSPRKVADLLGKRKVPSLDRAEWPVITLAGTIICVKDLPLSADCLTRSCVNKGNLVVIEERKKTMARKAARVLFGEEQIQKRVEEIAREVDKDFAGHDLSVVSLLEDSFVFAADLIRKIDREVLCYFMKADVDEGEDRVSSIKRILYSPELDARDRSVLLVGGVLDTGITLDYITKHILQGGPRLLKICYLLDKPKFRRISINADYAAFVFDSPESEYLVGYGLGYRNRFRNLPYLGVLSEPER